MKILPKRIRDGGTGLRGLLWCFVEVIAVVGILAAQHRTPPLERVLIGLAIPTIFFLTIHMILRDAGR